ncbi:50S ribosomal protein L32 [Rubinisphaera margarita]|uniref:50S ribosomal protein L32 n=1 Tax=Rubinisphaera margarita TaxID=2909586 RepID=UPI001EE926F0|nr:50S ribosomal protein L32 [Rubinisphaera margarita]MCG6154552.1 50S ribosomal protein L32 [Rubinisphaera margarita]
MAIPKRRQSKSRSRKRRSHDAIKPLKLQYCAQCGQPTKSHVACPTCGHYMGRTVVEIED